MKVAIIGAGPECEGPRGHLQKMRQLQCADTLPTLLPTAGKSCRFLQSCRVNTGFRALRLLDDPLVSVRK